MASTSTAGAAAAAAASSRATATGTPTSGGIKAIFDDIDESVTAFLRSQAGVEDVTFHKRSGLATVDALETWELAQVSDCRSSHNP